MLQLSWKFGESNWNPSADFIVLMNSPGTNYVFNKHEDFNQYGSFAILSNIMPYLAPYKFGAFIG